MGFDIALWQTTLGVEELRNYCAVAFSMNAA